MACYIPRWYTRLKTVTHPGTNRARRALTSFMRRTPLTTTPRRQPRIGTGRLCSGTMGLIGLPDRPYFTGDPVFQPRCPASRKEAARETESPVGLFDYRLIQIGRIYKLYDSNLHHAAWCPKAWPNFHHCKSNSENILRSAYFAEIARFLDHGV